MMQFEYLGAPQRSPEWLAVKRGKIGASRLEDWLAVSKAKNGTGKPLKARLDYEKELMFERQFGVSFQTFVTDAMQDGIDFEDFARKQYEQITGERCEEVGCWYNDYFVASPDRKLQGKPAGIEIKIVKDNTFTEVLMNGVPPKHWKQIQGQLMATGWEYVDYVCVNFNSKKIVIVRVEPDLEFHAYLELALQEQLVTQPFALTNVHDVIGEIPSGMELGADISKSNSNVINRGW